MIPRVMQSLDVALLVALSAAMCAAVLAPDTRLSVLFPSAQYLISVAKSGADVTGAGSANASAHIELDNLKEVWSHLRK